MSNDQNISPEQESANYKTAAEGYRHLQKFRRVKASLRERREHQYNEAQGEVAKWVRETICEDLAGRMTMPLDEQRAKKKNFLAKDVPNKPDQVERSFIEGLDLYKKAAIVNLAGDMHHSGEFKHGISHYLEYGFGAGETKHFEKEYPNALVSFHTVKSRDKRFEPDLVAALIEGKVGFYRISAGEYNALQHGHIDGHIPKEYSRSYHSIPKNALSRMSLEEFKGIVANVLKEKNLPISLSGMELVHVPGHGSGPVASRIILERLNSPEGQLETAVNALKATLEPGNAAQQKAMAEVTRCIAALEESKKATER